MRYVMISMMISIGIYALAVVGVLVMASMR